MTKYISIAGTNAYDYYALDYIKSHYANVFQPKYGILYDAQENAVYVFTQRVSSAIYEDERQDSFSSELAHVFEVSNKDLMLIPLRVTFQLEDEDFLSAHQNVLIIDKRSKMMHRYDPAGTSTFALNAERNADINRKLDSRLMKLCALFEGYTFTAVNKYPLQNVEELCGRSLQNRNLCAFWCVLFVEEYLRSNETFDDVQKRLHDDIFVKRDCRRIVQTRMSLDAAIGQQLCFDFPEVAQMIMYTQRKLSDRDYLMRRTFIADFLDQLA